MGEGVALNPGSLFQIWSCSVKSGTESLGLRLERKSERKEDFWCMCYSSRSLQLSKPFFSQKRNSREILELTREYGG